MCNIFFHTLMIILYVSLVVSSLHVLFNMTSIDTYGNCGDIYLSFPEWKKKMS